MVAGACNPSYLGGWDGRINWTQEAELQWAEILPLHSHLGNKQQNSVSKKKLIILLNIEAIETNRKNH